MMIKVLKAPLPLLQEAQLSQRERATRYVSRNLVKCYTTVRKKSILKACNRWMTLKVTQCYIICCCSIGHISNNVYILQFPRYYYMYSSRDWLPVALKSASVSTRQYCWH